MVPVAMRHARQKVLSRSRLKRLRLQWKDSGRSLVFTNGCFDLIHPGHVSYLEKARGLGDLLLVALNSDDSVSRLKGGDRPVMSQEARCMTLAGLESVDFVTVFEEDTPAAIIQEIVPDILVKGGDWSLDRIVGRRTVESAGGKVVAIAFEEGFSTSEIIERIRRRGR